MRRQMRTAAALGLVTLVHITPGCGHTTSQRVFARSVVLPDHALALANPQNDRVRWPIWGSAFSSGGAVRARITLDASTNAGITVGPFTLTWTGMVWKLAEADGHDRVLHGSHATSFVIEVAAGAQTVRVRSDDGATAELSTTRAADAPGIGVTLAPRATLSITSLALDQPLMHVDLDTPLATLANEHARSFGSTSETGEWPPRSDLAFETIWARDFDTAGILDFYWTTTRGEDEDYDFVPADLAVNYATVHDQHITGYFLVWDEELPAWLENASDVGAELDRHIETVVGRYKGRVGSWIVANEAFYAGEYAHTFWYDALGEGYIERAFRKAHAVDPAAQLIYNETGAEDENPTSDFMYARIRDLRSRGVPVDAVGFQFHLDAAHPPDMASVKRNLARFGALGVDVMITELDVNLASLPGTQAQRLATQAALYRAVVETCLAVPACTTITTFGISDKAAWDELGPSAEPLLLTRDYQPKPAYRAVVDALTSP